MLCSIFLAVTVLLHAGRVYGQNSVNLPGFISQVASLASDLGTPIPASSISTSAPSSTSPSTSFSTAVTSSAASSSSTATAVSSAVSSGPTTTAPSSTASSSPAAAAFSSSASSSSTAAASSNSGIDAHTRTIIIAVCVPVGLLLLGILIGCLLCCCIRRRRRNRRAASPEVAAVPRNDWSRDNVSHHGYISSESDDTRHPRIPTGAAVRGDTSPLMAESHDRPDPVTTVHPAYRTNSWRNSGNVNAQNPFTPNPPITRKPVPNGRQNGHPVLAAGAGAALGAAAAHHHHKKQDERGYTAHAYRPLSSNPSNQTPYAEDEQERTFRDPNRPPTPFGLNAFGAASKRRSNGDIEPSVAAHDHERPQSHNIEAPTESQRRSLQEREMLAAEPPVPERSPKRTSFNGGYAPTEAYPPRPAFHGSTYASNDSGTSNESWQSAQVSHHPPPPQRNYWNDPQQYVPEPRHSEDHGYSDIPLVTPHAAWNGSHRNSGESAYSWTGDRPRRAYGPDGSPRRSYGPDGKPRRLRFSDLQPEEYHYNYEDGHQVGQAL